MTSLIDPTKPTTHIAYTADVRNNFQIAANEITALQSGGQINPGGLLIGTAGTVPGAGSLTLNANTVAPPANTVFAAPSLEILGANGAYTSLCLDNYSTAASSNYIAARRARGTAAAPTAVQSGDSLSLWGAQGYDGANYSTFGATMIAMSASENFTGSARGTGITFATTPTGTLASVNSLVLQGNSATFSGNVTLPAGTGDLYLAGGTSGTAGRIASDGNNIIINAASVTGSIIFSTSTASVNTLVSDSGGNLTITGATATKPGSTSWVNPSAREIKQDIQPYAGSLGDLLDLTPITYRYNDDSGFNTSETHIGLVHDETAHMPEMHRIATIGQGEEAREVDALDCSAITFALINACKELAAQNAALVERLAALEAKVGV